jgi:poly(ADP-ribose) glycohydrolase ARH3
MSVEDEALDRAAGAILGAFLGDALGMPFEGLPVRSIPQRVDLEAGRLPRGHYTDDTQMTLALARALLADPALDDLDGLLHEFHDAAETHRGYGRGTREVLALAAQGVPAREAAAQVGPGGSYGNGAAMRVSPVAVRHRGRPGALAAIAARSAEVTHAHPVGIDGAVVQCAAVGAALEGADVLDAARRVAATAELREGLQAVEQLLATGERRPEAVAGALGNDATAHRSVPAALFTVLAWSEPERVLVEAIRLGGDTDTIASMAGAIAGARVGAGALPPEWLDQLENGERGRDHAVDLAHRLARESRTPA